MVFSSESTIILVPGGGGGGHYSALINAMVALSTGSLDSVQLNVPPPTSSMHARVALQSALINAIVAVDTGPFFLVHWLPLSSGQYHIV